MQLNFFMIRALNLWPRLLSRNADSSLQLPCVASVHRVTTTTGGFQVRSAGAEGRLALASISGRFHRAPAPIQLPALPSLGLDTYSDPSAGECLRSPGRTK